MDDRLKSGLECLLSDTLYSRDEMYVIELLRVFDYNVHVRFCPIALWPIIITWFFCELFFSLAVLVHATYFSSRQCRYLVIPL